MNKLLLSSAVAVLALSAAPAFAQDDSTLKLNLGGHFKGYVNYTDQDDELIAGSTSGTNDFDILRQTEVHFGGETTLDNGLTVGAQIEAIADGGESFDLDESYVYMAGTWGRVNFGDEDGAAYLLQVAAPSGDDNIDGIRQFINPINYGTAGAALSPFYDGGIDYANDIAGNADKITYLTPVYSGFQAGVSYTPTLDTDDVTVSRGGNGNSLNDATSIDNVWEAALRYEGSFNNVGMILGGGYTFADSDTSQWNVGGDFDIGAFGLGAVYTQTEASVDGAGALLGLTDADTVVVGGDYTTGPFKVGVSYLTSDQDNILEVDRYTGGVIYTYGPGMSFRGSVSYADFDDAPGAAGDADATSVLLGTQINF
ncbi:MAG: porin [Micavibrio aeruginosavorus]|uniref:Porin n=1 Tax=Micavibrio aeruginosavorus TaxID=349221 RepID=A0A2W5FR81_9BACT|nr:MAG: porin [Micavibrio aeruginosavorus]